MTEYSLLDEQHIPHRVQSVQIDGRSYPIWQFGEAASHPSCLIIGSGRLCFRSLPRAFLEHYQVNVCDLYWSQDNALPKGAAEQLDVIRMAEHVNSVCSQLELKQPHILAHSCYGILALEAAKQVSRRPDRHASCSFGSILLLAAPPQWTASSITENLARFRREADPATIQQYEDQRAEFERLRHAGESELSVNAYIADTAIYWGDRHVSQDFIRRLWQGLEIDEAIANHYWGDLLPNHYQDALAHDINKVTCPVVLIAGRRDYDSCPLYNWEARFRPSKFQVIDCGEVGHWPSLEAPERFMQHVTLTG